MPPTIKKSQSLLGTFTDTPLDSNYEWIEKEYPIPQDEDFHELENVFKVQLNIDVNDIVDIKLLETLYHAT